MSRFSLGTVAAAVSLLTSGLTAGEADFREQGRAEQKVSKTSPISQEQTNAATSVSLAMVQLGILSGGPDKQIIGGKEVSVAELKAEVRKNYPLLSESQKTMFTRGFPGLADIVGAKNVQQSSGSEKEQKEVALTEKQKGEGGPAETQLTGKQQSAGIAIGLAINSIRLMKESGQERMSADRKEVSTYKLYEDIRTHYPLLSESQKKNFNKKYSELSHIIDGTAEQSKKR